MSDILNIIKAQRNGYLDSPNLNPDWKHGWNAAVGHVAWSVEQAQEQQADPEALAHLLARADEYATPQQYQPKSEPVYALVRALTDTVRQQQAALAAAWQEGRESVAADLAKPLPHNMIREVSANPYA